MELTAEQLSLSVFCAIACVAAAWDLWSGIIPNKLLVVGLVLGLAAHLFLPLATRDYTRLGGVLVASLGGALACGLVPLFLFSRRAMGGGDVKLLALAGFCAGPLRGLDIEVYAFVALLLYAPARLIAHGALLHTLRASVELLRSAFRRGGTPSEGESAGEFRFAPAVAVAAAFALIMHGGVR